VTVPVNTGDSHFQRSPTPDEVALRAGEPSEFPPDICRAVCSPARDRSSALFALNFPVRCLYGANASEIVRTFGTIKTIGRAFATNGSYPSYLFLS